MQIGTAKIDFEGFFIEGPAGRHSIEPKVMNLLGVLVEKVQLRYGVEQKMKR